MCLISNYYKKQNAENNSSRFHGANPAIQINAWTTKKK